MVKIIITAQRQTIYIVSSNTVRTLNNIVKEVLLGLQHYSNYYYFFKKAFDCKKIKWKSAKKIGCAALHSTVKMFQRNFFQQTLPTTIEGRYSEISIYFKGTSFINLIKLN